MTERLSYLHAWKFKNDYNWYKARVALSQVMNVRRTVNSNHWKVYFDSQSMLAFETDNQIHFYIHMALIEGGR